MKKMYCYDCNKDVRPKIRVSTEHYDFRGKEFDVTMDLFYCPFCNGEIADEEEFDNQLIKIWNGYLNCYNLSLNSFKCIRSSLGLSQESFAKALGWSKRSIVRYENKDEVPKGEYLSTYVKLNVDKDYILERLEGNKYNLSLIEYKNILEKLNLNLSVKARNAILYLLNDTPSFVMQLIKKMFAVDFLNYRDNGVSITDFEYVKMEYGPVINNYKYIINSMLKTGEIEISEAEIIGEVERFKYVAVWECHEEIFNEEELKILKEVKKKLSYKTSKELSDWSHEFKGWIDTPLNKVISYKKYAKDFRW